MIVVDGKKVRLLSLVLFFCLLLISLPSKASVTDEAQVFAKKSYESLLQMASGKTGDVAGAFGEVFDQNQFNERCFSNVKSKMTAEEYEKIGKVFADLFMSNLKKKSGKIVAKSIKNPQYKLKQVVGEEIHVIDALGQSQEGQRTLSFYLKKSISGEWKLIDLAVEGVLLSRNYKGGINRIYREKGFGELYKRFSDKLKES